VQLFEKAWAGKAIRLIGVGVSGFETGDRQLGLWDADEDAEQQRLESTLDDLRDRFGERIIQRGSNLRDREL
jgi:hypothetical protein